MCPLRPLRSLSLHLRVPGSNASEQNGGRLSREPAQSAGRQVPSRWLRAPDAMGAQCAKPSARQHLNGLLAVKASIPLHSIASFASPLRGQASNLASSRTKPTAARPANWTERAQLKSAYLSPGRLAKLTSRPADRCVRVCVCLICISASEPLIVFSGPLLTTPRAKRASPVQPTRVCVRP